jgi:hypothetical protein
MCSATDGDHVRANAQQAIDHYARFGKFHEVERQDVVRWLAAH